MRRKSKDWLARNQENVFEWGDMYIRGLLFQWPSTIKIQLSVLVYYKADLIIISLTINLFSPWYSWKIPELALNRNHPLHPLATKFCEFHYNLHKTLCDQNQSEFHVEDMCGVSFSGRKEGWYQRFNQKPYFKRQTMKRTKRQTLLKPELWVTSLSDTPRLQYYDVQTLEYRYISKLPMKNERITYMPIYP